MSDKTPYDDDILLWSEQQAAVIRRLRQSARDLPNEFDAENVAEEIESVGRSELAAVQSCIELLLLHLIKLVVEPNAEVTAHWKVEAGGFRNQARRRYVTSMRQRLDLDEIWTDVGAQLLPGYGPAEKAMVLRLPKLCPLSLDEILDRSIDVDGLGAVVAASLSSA